MNDVLMRLALVLLLAAAVITLLFLLIITTNVISSLLLNVVDSIRLWMRRAARKDKILVMNKDFNYCYGRGCILKEHCIRYTEGQKIPLLEEGWWWMDNCGENREGYISYGEKA